MVAEQQRRRARCSFLRRRAGPAARTEVMPQPHTARTLVVPPECPGVSFSGLTVPPRPHLAGPLSLRPTLRLRPRPTMPSCKRSSSGSRGRRTCGGPRRISRTKRPSSTASARCRSCRRPSHLLPGGAAALPPRKPQPSSSLCHRRRRRRRRRSSSSSSSSSSRHRSSRARRRRGASRTAPRRGPRRRGTPGRRATNREQAAQGKRRHRCRRRRRRHRRAWWSLRSCSSR